MQYFVNILIMLKRKLKIPSFKKLKSDIMFQISMLQLPFCLKEELDRLGQIDDQRAYPSVISAIKCLRVHQSYKDTCTSILEKNLFLAKCATRNSIKRKA